MTEQIFQAVEDKIREVIPKKDLDLIVDNIGVPACSYNWAFADGTSIAVNDGVIMVALKEGHARTADYIRKLREVPPAAFPANLFYFQPADMATQILSFGLTAQINVRTVGYDRVKNLRIAEELRRRMAAIPGVADAHLQQEVAAPDFYVQIDRARALQFGIAASDIGNNVNTSLASSEQVSPNFWTDPTNGIPYHIAAQTPEYQVHSLGDLGNTPVSTGAAPPTTEPVPGELSNVATFTRAGYSAAATQAQLEITNQEKIYRQVIAPFDGVTTQRNINVGSLITAEATSGTSMFSMVHSDVIRVGIYVPQDDTSGVKPASMPSSAYRRCPTSPSTAR